MFGHAIKLPEANLNWMFLSNIQAYMSVEKFNVMIWLSNLILTLPMIKSLFLSPERNITN